VDRLSRIVIRDVIRHVPGHRRQERLDSLGLALGHQLNLAGGQIAHMAGDGMSRRQPLGRVAEAHALHPTRVQNALANNGHHSMWASAL